MILNKKGLSLATTLLGLLIALLVIIIVFTVLDRLDIIFGL